MSEATQPKTYIYQLDAESFVKLFLASDNEFEMLKAEMLKNGIDGASGIERRLLNEDDTIPFSLTNNIQYTIIKETVISDDIIVTGTDRDICNSLICISSKFDNIFITNSRLANLDNNTGASLYFVSSTILDFNVNNNSLMGDIYIDTESIIGNFCIDNKSIISDFYVDSNSVIGDFNINHNSIIGNFDIHNSIAGAFQIFNNSLTKDIKIDRESIISSFMLDSSTLGNFQIINSSYTGDFSIDNCSIGDILINYQSIIGDFYINKSRLGKVFCYGLINSFNISDSDIPQIILDKCNIPELKVTLSCKLEAYITGGQINLIDFSKTTLSKETIISFSGTEIHALILDEFAMLGNLYFRQIKMLAEPFSLFKFEDKFKTQDSDEESNSPAIQQRIARKKELFNNYDNEFSDKYYRLPIDGITASTIRISQSSLGKTEFTECPLAEFNFEYNNSKITDCFISGGSVPGNNITIIDPVSKEAVMELEGHKQKASIYNQLTKIFEAQGDIYNATIFQAKWANHQEKYLRLKRKEENNKAANHSFTKRFKSYFDQNSQDIYTLWLNKISNNHGESWVRALGWLLGSAFVFYILYIWSIGRITSNNIDWNLLGYYFEFLNPLHKEDFIKYSGEASGYTIFIDFASKLFTAFFLYKFLAAFRKHGKK